MTGLDCTCIPPISTSMRISIHIFCARGGCLACACTLGYIASTGTAPHRTVLLCQREMRRDGHMAWHGLAGFHSGKTRLVQRKKNMHHNSGDAHSLSTLESCLSRLLRLSA